eukprot:6179847-Pleurochrysis_carterae.AAC.1
MVQGRGAQALAAWHANKCIGNAGRPMTLTDTACGECKGGEQLFLPLSSTRVGAHAMLETRHARNPLRPN